ncbi:MAG: hypothetical protein HW390_2239 [Candidatus Brocadiaceae bacterium]|nr:hypothetical protein [Candidatus Brocadiaceae bacterium]
MRGNVKLLFSWLVGLRNETQPRHNSFASHFCIRYYAMLPNQHYNHPDLHNDRMVIIISGNVHKQ